MKPGKNQKVRFLVNSRVPFGQMPFGKSRTFRGLHPFCYLPTLGLALVSLSSSSRAILS